jgi:hypothetical protein
MSSSVDSPVAGRQGLLRRRLLQRLSCSRSTSSLLRPSARCRALVMRCAARRLPAAADLPATHPWQGRQGRTGWRPRRSAFGAFVLSGYHWIFEADLIQRAGDPTQADITSACITGGAGVRGRAAHPRAGAAAGLPRLPAYGLFGAVPAGRPRPSRLRLRPDRGPARLRHRGHLRHADLVSATYIFLFILFGSFLEHAGMINLFNNLALGHRRPHQGRPGQGGGGVLRADGHHQRLGRGQRADHRPVHHPADEEVRLLRAFAGAVEATSRWAARSCRR